MIPMSCPSCGRRGNIPPDRLNTRMHCKKCDAVFFMDNSGKIVLGDPSQAGKKKDKAAKASKAPKAKAKRESDPADLGAVWRSIPMPARVGGGVVLLVLVIYMSGIKLPRFGSPPLPEALEDRAALVAQALVARDKSKLRRVTAPDTVADAEQWLDKARETLSYAEETISDISVYQPKQDDAAGKAETLVKLMTPAPDSDQPAPARLKNKEERTKRRAEALKKARAKSKGAEPPPLQGYDTDGTFDILLYWKKVDGKWLLDGSETLKNPPPPGGLPD